MCVVGVERGGGAGGGCARQKKLKLLFGAYTEKQLGVSLA